MEIPFLTPRLLYLFRHGFSRFIDKDRLRDVEEAIVTNG
jgi:hypothetical protein